jgi:D-arabinose 5-phosphate isomerase GutQ
VPAPTDADASTYRASLEYLEQNVQQSLLEVPPSKIVDAVSILLGAPAIFVYGAGRSGIIGRAFAMGSPLTSSARASLRSSARAMRS